jgi:hypothetical protein
MGTSHPRNAVPVGRSSCTQRTKIKFLVVGLVAHCSLLHSTPPAECVPTRASHESRQAQQQVSSSAACAGGDIVGFACFSFSRAAPVIVELATTTATAATATAATAREQRRFRHVSIAVASPSAPSIDPNQPHFIGNSFEARRLSNVYESFSFFGCYCGCSWCGNSPVSSAAAPAAASARIHRPDLRAAVGPAVGEL